MILTWDITDKCNLNCKHCGAKRKDRINEADWSENKEKLKRFESINIVGGEPLLYKDLTKVIKYLHRNSKQTSIITNGLGRTEDYLALIDAGLNSIYFSLDGDEKSNDMIRGKGVFRSVLNKLSYVMEYIKINELNVNIGINVTINGINKNSFRKMLNEIKTIVSDTKEIFFQFTSIDYVGNAIKNYDELFIEDDKYLHILEKLVILLEEYNIKYSIDFLYPIVGFYLNLKYGLSMQINYNGCSTLTETMYMDSQCNLSPCRKLSDRKFNIKADESFPEFYKDIFIKIKSNKRNKACNGCRFFDYCNPCFLEKEYDKIPELCNIALDKINSINMHNICVINNSPFIEYKKNDCTEVYFINENNYVEYTEDGKELFKLLNKKCVIGDIVSRFQMEENLIIEFILDEIKANRIKSLGIIEN